MEDRMMDAHGIEQARAALAAWDKATHGDSGDAELEAGMDLADVVRSLVGEEPAPDTALDRLPKALRTVAKGFEAAAKQSAGDAIEVVLTDGGTYDYFEVMLIDDAAMSTREFWFAVADEDEGDEGDVVEVSTGGYDLELGSRRTTSQWTDMPGLFEAFARWLREQAS